MKRMISAGRTFGRALETSALTVSLLFLVELLDYLLWWPIDALGIVPRTGSGLVGIFFAPLLHANPAHLLANAVPLFILLTLVFWDRRYRPDDTLAMIWFAGGFGTWLIGRGGALHLGASGLIYGLVVYLIAAGWWMRSWRAAIVAMLVFVFYWPIFYGVLPRHDWISWEAHLCGAAAGLIAAKRQHG